MIKNKIKRIIAREGLIFLGVVLVGTIIFLLVYFVNGDKYHLEGQTHFDVWKGDVLYIAIPFYTVYFIIRFVCWAIKTLKGEKA